MASDNRLIINYVALAKSFTVKLFFKGKCTAYFIVLKLSVSAKFCGINSTVSKGLYQNNFQISICTKQSSKNKENLPKHSLFCCVLGDFLCNIFSKGYFDTAPWFYSVTGSPLGIFTCFPFQISVPPSSAESTVIFPFSKETRIFHAPQVHFTAQPFLLSRSGKFR